jgi:hypothetical protein
MLKIFKLPLEQMVKQIVTTFALGSQPRQGLVKVWAKSEARKTHFMLSGV